MRKRQKSDKLDLETAIGPDVFVALFEIFLFVSFSSAQPNVKFNITHFYWYIKFVFLIEFNIPRFSFFSFILVQFLIIFFAAHKKSFHCVSETHLFCRSTLTNALFFLLVFGRLLLINYKRWWVFVIFWFVKRWEFSWKSVKWFEGRILKISLIFNRLGFFKNFLDNYLDRTFLDKKFQMSRELSAEKNFRFLYCVFCHSLIPRWLRFDIARQNAFTAQPF